MQRVDLVLFAAIVLVAVGLWLAVGAPFALIAVGVSLVGYWIVLQLDDEDAPA
jgi:hypothetical protein